jgi:predicted MFS family arabinose efflux permease
MAGHKATDVNGWPAIASAVVLGTIGVLSFIIQPGIVEGYSTALGLDATHAVDLAGLEMLGVALATVVLAAWGQHRDWRRVVATGLGIAVAGNLASALTTASPLFAWARMLAGFGEGTIISISFTFIGVTARTERNVALYLVLLLTYGAFGLWYLPTFLHALGFVWLFLGFAALSALALATIPFVPRSSATADVGNAEARQLPRAMLVVALGGVLAYNLAQGMAWAVLALVGSGAGLADQPIANALFLSQILAVCGALASVFLAHRLNRHGAIAFGILFGAASIALLLGKPTLLLFTVGVCGFNLLWNFVLPFILGRVCDFETSGRMMAFAIAMQMIGLGLGPLLSAQLMGADGYRGVELACIALFLTSYLLLFVPMMRHRRLLALA